MKEKNKKKKTNKMNNNGCKRNENNDIIVSKYEEKLYNKKLNEIMFNNNEINVHTNKIESKIENILKDYPIDSLNKKFNSIKDILKIISENIKKNNEIIINLLNNKNDEDNITNNMDNEKNEISNEKTNVIEIKKNTKNTNNKNILNKIRSNYILQRVFSYLNELSKLDLIKCNKNLQNKIDIKLINYKLYSGVYIEYEQDGKGKEYYYDGNLRFEGEYLNGKRVKEMEKEKNLMKMEY